MTINEVKDILESNGYSFDTWTTLDAFTHIVFTSENIIRLGRNSCRLYFASNGLVYIQNYDEKRFVKCEADTIPAKGCINVQIGDEYYLTRVVPGYIDTLLGPINSVLDMTEIATIADESITLDIFSDHFKEE